MMPISREDVLTRLREYALGACATFRPDHNGECTTCDEGYDEHLFRLAVDLIDPPPAPADPGPSCVCGHARERHHARDVDRWTQCQEATCRCQRFEEVRHDPA